MTVRMRHPQTGAQMDARERAVATWERSGWVRDDQAPGDGLVSWQDSNIIGTAADAADNQE